jgi:hypothetical protein
MGFWPWEVAEDATNAAIQAGVNTAVGIFVSIVGLAVIAGKVPVPGPVWLRYVIGVPVAIIGIAFALGVI